MTFLKNMFCANTRSAPNEDASKFRLFLLTATKSDEKSLYELASRLDFCTECKKAEIVQNTKNCLVKSSDLKLWEQSNFVELYLPIHRFYN